MPVSKLSLSTSISQGNTIFDQQGIDVFRYAWQSLDTTVVYPDKCNARVMTLEKRQPNSLNAAELPSLGKPLAIRVAGSVMRE